MPLTLAPISFAWGGVEALLAGLVGRGKRLGRRILGMVPDAYGLKRSRLDMKRKPNALMILPGRDTRHVVKAPQMHEPGTLRLRGSTALGVTLATLLGMSSVLAAELRLVEHFSNVFPDTTSVWRVETDAPTCDELAWALSLGNAVVDRGQCLLESDAGVRRAEISARIPPLREGVAMQAMLTVTAVGRGESASLVHPVWILPRDAWSELRGVLAGTPVYVYAPDGALLARLREVCAGAAPIRNPSAVATLTNGLVVVNEGLSLNAQRGLVDSLVRAAAGGARVLMLAPTEGAMPLPGHSRIEGLARPCVRMESSSALRVLDKRLDIATWPNRQAAVASSFVLSAERRQAEAIWSSDVKGWTWFEQDYRESGGGRLLVVGWAPMRDWDASPAPRHILAALMACILE